MSLPGAPRQWANNCFPRVSGDEPLPMPHLLGLAKFSPRERG